MSARRPRPTKGPGGRQPERRPPLRCPDCDAVLPAPIPAGVYGLLAAIAALNVAEHAATSSSIAQEMGLAPAHVSKRLLKAIASPSSSRLLRRVGHRLPSGHMQYYYLPTPLACVYLPLRLARPLSALLAQPDKALRRLLSPTPERRYPDLGALLPRLDDTLGDWVES